MTKVYVAFIYSYVGDGNYIDAVFLDETEAVTHIVKYNKESRENTAVLQEFEIAGTNIKVVYEGS